MKLLRLSAIYISVFLFAKCSTEKEKETGTFPQKGTWRAELSIPDQKVIPLMILSLVENAFKHGASKDPGHPSIKINIDEKNKWLNCLIINSIPDLAQKDHTGYTRGIGIENIQRQLEILYPSKHYYEVTKSDNSYQVLLRLNQK